MNKIKEILGAIKTKDTLTACIVAVLTVIATVVNDTVGGDNPLIGNEFIITIGGGISAFLMGSHRKTQTPVGK
jgi:flagellar motor component MotA|tara:strand:+ start:1256 stop:1474 length:219 start_codon:yes stop_codon:yes gene_type:complete